MTAGHFFFKYRSYTPIPLLVLLFVLAKPTPLSLGCGLVVLLLGEVFRFWGILYAGSATRTTGEVGAGRLVTDGPFAHVRNPLYLGNFLISVGLVIMSRAGWPWMFGVFLLAFGLQYGLIVREEERFLAEKFGDQYTEYRQHVPRWIPRIRGFSNSAPSHPVFRKALHSERNTLQALAAVVALMILRWRLG